MKKINYSSHQAPHYQGKLFLFFLVITFLITLATTITLNQTNTATFLIKFTTIFFLIITIAILIETKNRSEYISPFETINIKQFFNHFNTTTDKKKYINKYNAKTLKQLKKNIKNNIKYQLTNIIKKNKYYELHICEKPDNTKLYLLKFLFKRNNHKITILEENNKIKIIKIN